MKLTVTIIYRFRGDPDKCDYIGNSALHWASQNGHINCVYFLVNFGVNIWAVDNFKHTAREVAAMKGQQEILRLLDAEDAKQTLKNKKHVQTLKEKAKKDAEKRIKQAEKMHQQEIKANEKLLKRNEKQKKKIKGENDTDNQPSIARPSISIPNEELRRDSRFLYQSSYSDMVNPKNTSAGSKIPMSGVAQRLYRKKEVAQNSTYNDDFKIREIDDDGNHTIRSLTGIRKGSDVMYVPKFPNQGDPPPGQKKHISDIFFVDGTDSSSTVSNYIMGDPMYLNPEPKRIFERPGFGKVAFRQNSLTGSSLMSIPPDFGNQNGYSDDDEDSAHGSEGHSGGGSGIRKSHRQRPKEIPWSIYDNHGTTDSALETFLTAYDLRSCLPYLRQHQIDLNALLLLSENDLKDAGIPIGYCKKLLEAIELRKSAMRKAEEVKDSKL